VTDLALPDAHWDLSGVGLRITDPNLSYGEFEHLCGVLGALHEAVRFAIGDAIIQGEALYGETAYQAFEAFQLSEEAMKEYVRVAQRVPRSRRKKGLSWSHHRAVAALEPPAQKEWLARAVEDSLSHHQLRDALRNPSRNGAEPECCPTCGRRMP
jgi:hypothetical protein